jgi:hypothetical protein
MSSYSLDTDTSGFQATVSRGQAESKELGCKAGFVDALDLHSTTHYNRPQIAVIMQCISYVIGW